MELEQSKDRIEQQGLGMAAISYDSHEVLVHAAQRLGISFPLLSDEGSSIIQAFGILNTNIPEGHSWHGIPFPGTYIVDGNGKVVSKYFERYHRQRYTADTILAKQFGVFQGRRTTTTTNHLTLSASVTQDTARRGNRVMLVLEAQLPPGMHVYAPGVRGYRPVAFRVERTEHVLVHEAQFPEPEILHLPAIRESVPVYYEEFVVTRDITISPKYRESRLNIPAVFEYQACDDEICYPPSKVSLNFVIQLEDHDGQRVPEVMRKKGSKP